MYKNLNFTHPGGLWLTQDILKDMQDTYSPAFDAIAGLVGNKAIVSGVKIINTNVTAGWVVLNGELLPLLASQYADNVDVQTTTLQEQYEDGTQKNFIVKKELVLVPIATGTSFPFSELVRPGEFKNTWLPGDTKSVLCDNNYITANFDLVTGIALPTSERAGWKIAFDMGGRVMMGWSKNNTDPGDGIWDIKYNTMQDVGGEKLHQLIANENAPHTHTYKRTRTDQVGTQYEANHMDGGGDRGLYIGDTIATSSSGNGDGHNNVQPYKVYLFIEKM